MTETLVLAHSGWRWIVLIMLLVAAAEGLFGWNGARPWRPRSRHLAVGAAIAFDIQVLLGLLVYVAERRWTGGDPFYSYIHPFVMLVGLAVVHVTSMRVKSSDDPQTRHRWLALGCILALVIVVVGGAVLIGEGSPM